MGEGSPRQRATVCRRSVRSEPQISVSMTASLPAIVFLEIQCFFLGGDHQCVWVGTSASPLRLNVVAEMSRCGHDSRRGSSTHGDFGPKPGQIERQPVDDDRSRPRVPASKPLAEAHGIRRPIA